MNEKKAAPRPKKTKAQLKKEKLMSATMAQTSKKTLKNTGLVAVQPEKSIFQTSKGGFVKIYSVKGLDNSEMRKEMLIETLYSCATHRLRISSFMYAGNSVPLFFLSVFFYGSSYAEIFDEAEAFDGLLDSVMKENIRVTIKPCSVSDIFMFIYMNYNGQMKKISQKAVMKKSANWHQEYFGNIFPTEKGYCIPKINKFGCCYMPVQYPESSERIFDRLIQVGCTILSSVDIQNVPDKYLADYKEYVEEIYNGKVNEKRKHLTNVTFLFTVLTNSEKELQMVDRIVRDSLFNNGYVITKCAGIESTVVDSIASMGLLDFHCMRNVNENIIANFLI